MYKPIKITYKPKNPDVKCQGLTPANEDDCPADCTYVKASSRSDAHCRRTQRQSQTENILRPEDFQERAGFDAYANYPKYSLSPRGNPVRKSGQRKVPNPSRLSREGMAQWFARATVAKSPSSSRSAAGYSSPRSRAAESKRGSTTRRTQAAPTTRLPPGMGAIVGPIVTLATSVANRDEKSEIKETKGLGKVDTAVNIIEEKLGDVPADVVEDVAQAISQAPTLTLEAKRSSLQRLNEGDLGGALSIVASNLTGQKRSRTEPTGQELMLIDEPSSPSSPTYSPPTTVRRISSSQGTGSRRGSRASQQ